MKYCVVYCREWYRIGMQSKVGIDYFFIKFKFYFGKMKIEVDGSIGFKYY